MSEEVYGGVQGEPRPVPPAEKPAVVVATVKPETLKAIKEAEDRVDVTESDLEKMETLTAKGEATPEQLDEAIAARLAASTALAAARRVGTLESRSNALRTPAEAELANDPAIGKPVVYWHDRDTARPATITAMRASGLADLELDTALNVSGVNHGKTRQGVRCGYGSKTPGTWSYPSDQSVPASAL